MTVWEVLAGLGGILLGSGGLAGLLRFWPDRRKTNADAELAIQQAAARAVETVQEVAADAREALKEARTEIKQLKADLVQSREDVRQARDELSALREQASAERQQLQGQMARERSEHARALQVIRKLLTAGQLQQAISDGITALLSEDSTL
jgi:chromosome segregation ATPase